MDCNFFDILGDTLENLNEKDRSHSQSIEELKKQLNEIQIKLKDPPPPQKLDLSFLNFSSDYEVSNEIPMKVGDYKEENVYYPNENDQNIFTKIKTIDHININSVSLKLENFSYNSKIYGVSGRYIESVKIDHNEEDSSACHFYFLVPENNNESFLPIRFDLKIITEIDVDNGCIKASFRFDAINFGETQSTEVLPQTFTFSSDFRENIFTFAVIRFTPDVALTKEELFLKLLTS